MGPPTSKRTKTTKTFETDGQKLQVVTEEEEVVAGSTSRPDGCIDLGNGDHYAAPPPSSSGAGAGGKRRRRIRQADESDGEDGPVKGGKGSESAPAPSSPISTGGGGADQEDKFFLKQMNIMAQRSAAAAASGVVTTTRYSGEDESESDNDDADEDGGAGASYNDDASEGGGAGKYGFGTLPATGAYSGAYLTAAEMSDKLIVPKEKCWGCIHAFRKQRQPGKNKAADDLVELRSQNESTMSKAELAKLIAAAYEKLVMIPAVLLGETPMPFTEHIVLRHLLYHERNVESTLSDVFYRTNEMIVTANDSVFVRMGTGFEVDLKKFGAFKELVKLNLALGVELRKSGRTA